MIEYKLLKEIEQNPVSTQRTLANKLDVSLGKINYVISGLARKGLVRVQKFKDDPRNLRWKYLLTPEGINEKLRITREYLEKRLREFDEIQSEIETLRKEVTENGAERSAGQVGFEE